MSRVNVRVRPASHDDIPALIELIQTSDASVGLFGGKPPQDQTSEHIHARLREILESDRVLLTAVDEGGAAVGVLCARKDEVGSVDLTPVVHVTHLLVEPGHRRRGVGRALLAATVQLAEQEGVEHLLATAAAGSREANRYLARIGFAPLVVHRIAPTSALRRSLGMTDVAGRMAVLRRARLVRAQRAGFATRAVRREA